MDVRFEFDHPKLGSMGFTFPAYQNGFSDGVEWMQRDLGTTPAGVRHMIRRSISRRLKVIQFARTDDILMQMQDFHVMVQRYVKDVRFYPNYDTDPGTFWECDWQLVFAQAHPLDNRREIELQIEEKPPVGGVFI